MCADGGGKSLTIDRLVEAAVDRNLSSQIAPVPIYVDATTVSEGLEQACLAASGSIGNPRIQGAAVFIDRADELGTRAILQLLDEARVLVGTWRYSTAVITTRWFDREDEDVVTLPPLDSDKHELSSHGWSSGMSERANGPPGPRRCGRPRCARYSPSC